MDVSSSCPICSSLLLEAFSMQSGQARINCPNCGEYDLSEEYYSDVIANNSLNPTQMATLSYAIRSMQSPDGQAPRIFHDTAEDILKTTTLPNANEQIDNLILFMGREQPRPGTRTDLYANDLRARLGCIDAGDAKWVISQAMDRKLIESLSGNVRSANGSAFIGVTLTIDGWNHFQKIQPEGFLPEIPFSAPLETLQDRNSDEISGVSASRVSNIKNDKALSAEASRHVNVATTPEISKDIPTSLGNGVGVSGYKVVKSEIDANTNTADIPITVGSGSLQFGKEGDANLSFIGSLRKIFKGGGADTSEQTNENDKDNKDRNSDEQSNVEPPAQIEPGATAKEPIRIERIAEKDLLDRERLIDAVNAFLTQRIDTNSLAIALFGDWGTGKTSFIKLLTKRLSESTEGKKVHVVTFNAWHHEQVEKPAAALAQAIVEGIVKDLDPFEEAWLAWKFHLQQMRRGDASTNSIEWKKTLDNIRDFLIRWLLHFGVIMESWFSRFLLCLFVLLTSICIIYLGNFNAVWSKFITAASGIGFVSAAIAGSKFVEKWVSKNLTQWFKKINLKEVAAKFRMPDYKVHLGIYHEIHCTLKILCDLRFGKNGTAKDESLLLVVDDLDRCSPAMVKAMFDSIRLVADVERVVTIVAIDERIAYAAVSKYFSEFGSAGRPTQSVARDYLSKVFGLSITLPNAGTDTVGRFIRESLFVGDAASNGIGEQSEKNDDSLVPEEISVDERRAAFDRIREGGKTNTIGTMINDQKRKKSNDQKNTVDPESASQPPEAPPVLANFCVGEPDLFAELARDYGFHNPRQLWRLRQSWQLCKQLNLNENYRLSDVQPWLTTLFWCEWCLDRRDDNQGDAMARSNEISDPDSAIGNDLPDRAKPTKEEFADRKLRVKSIILPAAPFQ